VAVIEEALTDADAHHADERPGPATDRSPRKKAADNAVEYDFHHWSDDDIDDVFVRVKRWCIPHAWNASTKVLKVPPLYEEAMDKLVLGGR